MSCWAPFVAREEQPTARSSRAGDRRTRASEAEFV